MNVGIVGSRRYQDKDKVCELVDSLNEDDIVVSGGAKGPDSFAEKRAKERGLKTLIFRPKMMNVSNKFEVIESYYARNKQIAENSDVIYAFVVDGKGGTWNTIKHAKKLNKEVIIIKQK